MIHTLSLFPVVDRHLITLLSSLSSADWEKPTQAGHWRVKDVAYHLLDGSIRGISQSRDKYFPVIPEDGSYASITDFINDQNQLWVSAAQRISYPLLIEYMQVTSKRYYEHLASLDLMGKAIFGVSWAGEEESLTWFHIAREYTEKWHHTQQIYDAVGQKSPLMEVILYEPFLDTCMCALPHHYRSVEASLGSCIKFQILYLQTCWYLKREEGGWHLSREETPHQTQVSIPKDTAWKIFTRGISADEASASVQIEGDQVLGGHILSMLTFMISPEK